MRHVPPRSELNTSERPSRDQDGCMSHAGPLVSRIHAPSPAGRSHRSPSISTTRRPSKATAGERTTRAAAGACAFASVARRATRTVSTSVRWRVGRDMSRSVEEGGGEDRAGVVRTRRAGRSGRGRSQHQIPDDASENCGKVSQMLTVPSCALGRPMHSRAQRATGYILPPARLVRALLKNGRAPVRSGLSCHLSSYMESRAP